jgi:molybdopterin synthase catalytic subunit/molybdopterin converting factor small subunit
MTVRIAYFAAARDLAECSNEEVEYQHTLDVEQFKAWLGDRKPRLKPYLSRMRLAIDGEFAASDALVRDGSEVAVMPPVAGGSGDENATVGRHEVSLAEVRERPLSIDEAIDAVRDPSAGGIAVFLGVVRDHHQGKAVERLDYEAFTELANKELRSVLAKLVTNHPGTRLAALHRVGALAIGDTAVVVAASAAHREQAFALCRLAIDRIKESVPIWKKEWAPDGSALWVNLEADERK